MTTSELADFKETNSLVIGLVPSPIGEIYAVLSGSINPADPYEVMALNELLLLANEPPRPSVAEC